MKKILVLVMVFMALGLSGCRDENGDVTNFQRIKTQNEEILERLDSLEWKIGVELKVIGGLYEETLDRLDTIDMNIDRIEDENMNNIECVIDMLDGIFDDIINDEDGIDGFVYDKDNQLISIYRSDGTLSIEFTLYEMYDSWCN
jgi:hypothetical protein